MSVAINCDCQPDRIWNQLGDQPLGKSLRGFLDGMEMGRSLEVNSTLPWACWGPELKEKKDVSWAAAFISVS